MNLTVLDINEVDKMLMKSIFDKTSIKGKELKNRVFRSGTWMAMADEEGNINSEVVDLYENYAKGEIGSIVTGVTSVCDGDERIDGMMSISNDSFIDVHKELTSRVHEYGSLIFLQIAIVDLHTRGLDTVTNLRYEDLDRIVSLFKDAAVRADEAGYDGVQLHVAHFLFLSKFISPLYNNRLDRYGKTNEGRCRLIVEILDGIRSVVSSGFIVSVKINSSDFIPNGLVEDDFLEICEILDGEGVDFIEVSGNSPYRPTIQDASDEAYFLDSAVKLKERVSCPVVLTGGHRSIENMECVLNSTGIEYLGLSRPFIYEPYLLRRWLNGDTSPSKCISCNFCYKTLNHECVYKIG